MKFRPLHDRVVVRRIGEDTKTAGGIIIPDTAQEKPHEGEIVEPWHWNPGRNAVTCEPLRTLRKATKCPVRQVVRHRCENRWRRPYI